MLLIRLWLGKLPQQTSYNDCYIVLAGPQDVLYSRSIHILPSYPLAFCNFLAIATFKANINFSQPNLFQQLTDLTSGSVCSFSNMAANMEPRLLFLKKNSNNDWCVENNIGKGGEITQAAVLTIPPTVPFRTKKQKEIFNSITAILGKAPFQAKIGWTTWFSKFFIDRIALTDQLW